MRKLFTQGADQGVTSHFFHVIEFPVMDCHGFHTQDINVFGRREGRAKLALYLVAITGEQVAPKSVKDGVVPSRRHHAFQISAIPACGFVEKAVPAFIIINRFRHVVFLLLVSGVAANTLAGFGVAFYFGSAS